MKHIDDAEDRIDDEREVFFFDVLPLLQLLNVAEEFGTEDVAVVDDREKGGVEPVLLLPQLDRLFH